MVLLFVSTLESRPLSANPFQGKSTVAVSNRSLCCCLDHCPAGRHQEATLLLATWIQAVSDAVSLVRLSTDTPVAPKDSGLLHAA